jgi:hypothetical protein
MRFEGKARVARHGFHGWRLVHLALVLAFVAVWTTTYWDRGGLLPALLYLGVLAIAMRRLLATGMRKVPTRKHPERVVHDVVADAAGVTVDGTMAMPRRAIARGYCVPVAHGLHAVHLEGRRLRRGLTLWVDSRETGAAFLSALHVAPSMSTAHFRALPAWMSRVRLLFLAPVLAAVMHRQWTSGLIVVALLGVIGLPKLFSRRVGVGHDGVYLRGLGTKRFIAFSNILHATATRVGVNLRLQSRSLIGELVQIRLTSQDDAADAQVQLLLGRIQDGLAAQQGLSRSDEEVHLARGPRDVATWMREMRALGAGDSRAYRTWAIPRERLWAVVENSAADPSARQGAALALSASLDDDERERILALADQTASPRLRVALDSVGRERDEVRLRVAVETAERETESAETEDVTSDLASPSRSARTSQRP